MSLLESIRVNGVEPGAVNAMKFEGDRVIAENFDGVGLVCDLVRDLNRPLAGKRVLLLSAGGDGGAASCAVLLFLEQEPAQSVIFNRTVSKAQKLVAKVSAIEAMFSRWATWTSASSSSMLWLMPPLPACTTSFNRYPPASLPRVALPMNCRMTKGSRRIFGLPAMPVSSNWLMA